MIVLFFISLIAFIYSVSVQLFRLIKNKLTPAYKKTPEYQAFLKELNSMVKLS